MEIALTKKILDALDVEVRNSKEDSNPLFCWIANWTNVWSNRKEDMLVLTNKASRFCVACYPFKRRDFKRIREIIPEIIKTTFEALNLNPAIITAYLNKPNSLEFIKNNDRAAASHITRACIDSAIYVSDKLNKEISIKNSDIGMNVSMRPVACSQKAGDGYFPYEKMFDLLSEYTGLPKYDFDAYELIAELNLEKYVARRRIIVPQNYTFEELHIALQRAFSWHNCHAYEFSVTDCDGQDIVTLTDEELVDLYENAEKLTGKKISSYLYDGRQVKYIYDFGDCWEHCIKIVKEIAHCDLEVPYLVEAEGVTPPEDVGGVGGYLEFLDIISDPGHPDYTVAREWAGFWSPELPEYKKTGVLFW